MTKGGPVSEFRDPDRVYVDAGDRVGNVDTLHRILGAGFPGVASFEPFSPSVHELDKNTMEQRIVESKKYILNKIIN